MRILTSPPITRSLLALVASLTSALIPSAHAAPAQQQIDLRGMGYVTGLIAHPLDDELLYARTDTAGVFRWLPAENRWLPLMGALSADPAFAANVESFAIDPSNSANKGRLLAAVGAYVQDGVGPNAILRSDDYGATWSYTNFPTTVEIGGNNDWRWAGERLLIDPRNSDYVYYGTRQNGLWRSTDGGLNWTNYASAAPAGLPFGDTGGLSVNGGISFIVADPRAAETVASPTRAKTLYAGIVGAGVYRSTDGGSTWTSITTASGPGSTAFANLNPTQARVASDGVLFLSAQADKGTGGSSLWRFQNDTWTSINPSLSLTYTNRKWTALAVDPLNPARLVAADDGNFARDLFYSTDRGATWTILTSDNPAAYSGKPYRPLQHTVPGWWSATNGYRAALMGALTFSPRLDGTRSDRVWGSSGWGVHRTDDITAATVGLDSVAVMKGMEQFCVMRAEILPAGAPRRYLVTVMDQIGFALADATTAPAERIGGTDIEIGTSLALSPSHPLHLLTAYKSNNNNSGGLRRSTDGGVTWQTLTAPNSSYGGHLAMSATNPLRFLWVPHNTTDTRPPLRTLDGGATWQAVIGLPSTKSTSFPTANAYWNNQVVAADGVNGDTYYIYHYSTATGGTQWKGSFWRSTDAGLNWTATNITTLGQDYRAWVETEPGFANEVWTLIGGTNLYQSLDGGTTHTKLTTITTEIFSLGPKLTASQTAPTLYVVGTQAGAFGLHRSVDRGLTWTRLPVPTDVPLGYASRVTVDPSDASRVIVGTGGNGVYLVTGLPTPIPPTGSIRREFWSGVSGTQVSNIPVATTPTTTGSLTTFEAPKAVGDNYGQRLRGYLVPPASGNYTFWTSGDDSTELWLSTTSNPANKVRIAYNTAYTTSREWNKYATQKSAPIALVAGEAYYIEALHKEGSGGDNLAVAWKLNSTANPTNTSGTDIIPGTALAPWVP